MNVVILAAGTSRRLLPLTKQKPKTLLLLSKNTSLLSNIFDSLKNNRKHFSRLTIVGGHGFRFLQETIKSLNHVVPISPTLIFNPNYQTMNNCYSLLLAIKNNPHHDLLVIHSDVIYEPTIVDKVIHVPHTTLVVDNKKVLTEESMKVYVQHKRITDISKELNLQTSYGEYIGVARIQKEHLPKLAAALRAVVRKDPHMFYEEAFRSILGDIMFRVIDTDGLPWTEVDNQHDLRLARRIYRSLPSYPRT